MAVLGPVPGAKWKSPRNSWAARGIIAGDIVNADSSGHWDIVNRK